jgi:CAAX protease family protein
MKAALPAFLVESAFYLASVFGETRLSYAMLSSRRSQGLLLWTSALVPYLILSLLSGTYHRNAFQLLVLLTGVLTYWYILLPRRMAYDIGFLVVAAAPILLHVFPRIYLSGSPQMRVDVLGHLMWIRLAIMVLLIFREWDPGAFGLWPEANEWRIGLLYYAAAILPIALLALALHDVQFAPREGEWWQVGGLAVGTFFGILWIVAISEELFFRGVIERALLNGWNSKAAAIGVSAVLFGSAHLWFHHFPNWPRALVATVLGVACGIAYAQTGSVRAPMVTHAFVVTTWRILFTK